jgi:hypothetical protein
VLLVLQNGGIITGPATYSIQPRSIRIEQIPESIRQQPCTHPTKSNPLPPARAAARETSSNPNPTLPLSSIPKVPKVTLHTCLAAKQSSAHKASYARRCHRLHLVELITEGGHHRHGAGDEGSRQ